MLIFAPIFVRSAQAYHINLVYFGVVMVIALCVGLVTPPVGINLFVGAPLVNESPTTIGKAALPAIGFFLLALLMITYIPVLSLALI